ncbi:MAG: HlyD family secretion protein [bacterium]
MRRRNRIMILVLIIIALLSLVFVSIRSRGNKDFIEANGFIEGDIVDVSSKVSARVKEVLVSEGDSVKSGQPLLVLDLREMDYSLSSLDKTISSLWARADELRARLENARKDLKRIEKLRRDDMVSPSALDNAVVQYETLNSQYQSLLSQIEAQKSTKKITEVQLEEETILSPIDGIVDSLNIDNGELALVGRSLVSILNSKSRYIRVYLSEEELPEIKVGDEVDIHIDAFKDKTFRGKISYISGKAEFTPTNVQTKRERVNLVYMVKIEILEGLDLMHIGIPADVVFRSRK